MPTTELAAAYGKLGVLSSASKAEVKEAFVRLCKQCHPDKVPPAQRAVAEARFREIKEAYDAILRGQAGYNVPPPGSRPNPKYARAYYQAHGMGMDFGERGPVRCGGPYGGFATEWDFYRAMFRTTRNNPFVLIATGFLAIPAISLFVSAVNGDTDWVKQFRDQGLHVFGQESLKANGRDAVGINPFAIRRLEDIHDSYIYKDEKYAHLRK
ncbi:molecular chaperone [Volvox carteri f. nagariensis]|uniref:Molecular chaperone n=1 Tax=Volvox carteri f. nagariensis TaxID=3068 RepID=D8TX40_VOLCA|nr:molecular chaperone [Volvox carteri f. nagariensis]EFJ47841.1 molecular chaperone [Volvox carteri f. nagariensis]|eukprot:XP_002950947.1 molecular chaperone [Volvox carteri f. nagariensis]